MRKKRNAGKSRKAEKQRGKETEKQKSRKSKKQRSKEAEKHEKAIKRKSREAGQQGKAEKQRSRESREAGNKKSKKGKNNSPSLLSKVSVNMFVCIKIDSDLQNYQGSKAEASLGSSS